MSAYFMPDNLFAWLNRHVGQKVYIKTPEGEWAGRIAHDSPVGTVDLVGTSFRTRIREDGILGVELAQ